MLPKYFFICSILYKGDDIMATTSILKNVEIQNQEQCMALITALEDAVVKKAKDVTLSKPYIEIHGSQFNQLFGKNYD